MARERAEASIKEVETYERELKMEVESTASLAFTHGEADELTRQVAFLEGEHPGIVRRGGRRQTMTG
jgi:hypothetical protein